MRLFLWRRGRVESSTKDNGNVIVYTFSPQRLPVADFILCFEGFDFCDSEDEDIKFECWAIFLCTSKVKSIGQFADW